MTTYGMFTLGKHKRQAYVFAQADDNDDCICNISTMRKPASRYPNNIAQIRLSLGDGWTLQRVADLSGLSRGFISLLENGKKQLTQDSAIKISAALGCSVSDLYAGNNSVTIEKHNSTKTPKVVRSPFLGEAQKTPDARLVPVVGVVQAGAYVEVAAFDYIDENTEFVPFYDPRYDKASIKAVRVRGESTNLIYPDGTIIYFAPAVETGIRENQFVIVMRILADGIAEFTIKQAVKNGDVLELWPRSTDKRYQEPILYHRRNEHSQDGPQIIGVVIGAYTPAEQPTGPLLLI